MHHRCLRWATVVSCLGTLAVPIAALAAAPPTTEPAAPTVPAVPTVPTESSLATEPSIDTPTTEVPAVETPASEVPAEAAIETEVQAEIEVQAEAEVDVSVRATRCPPTQHTGLDDAGAIHVDTDVDTVTGSDTGAESTVVVAGRGEAVVLTASIAVVETGFDFHADHGGVSGAYLLSDADWGGYGGYARAADAPAEVQMARAEQLAAAVLASGTSTAELTALWLHSNSVSASGGHGGPVAAYIQEVAEHATAVAAGEAIVIAAPEQWPTATSFPSDSTAPPAPPTVDPADPADQVEPVEPGDPAEPVTAAPHASPCTPAEQPSTSEAGTTYDPTEES